MSDNAREKRLAFQQSLRDMADFFAAHPEVPTPSIETVFNLFPRDKEELAEIAKAGSWNKHYDDTWFYLSKNFGDKIRLDANVYRDVVCRKIVKGTKVVPARPEQIVEDVEWVCDDASLLAEVKS